MLLSKSIVVSDLTGGRCRSPLCARGHKKGQSQQVGKKAHTKANVVAVVFNRKIAESMAKCIIHPNTTKERDICHVRQKTMYRWYRYMPCHCNTSARYSYIHRLQRKTSSASALTLRSTGYDSVLRCLFCDATIAGCEYISYVVWCAPSIVRCLAR